MRKINVLFVLILLILSACGGGGVADADKQKSPIVTVRDKTLYKSDLDAVLPSGISPEDSIIASKSYINTWINDKLIYDKAKRNILNKEAVEELVENYRKSLITNSYQEQLLRERFSGPASESQLRTYYEQYKDQIKLEENIIKGLYLKVPIDSKELPNFLKWYKQTTDAAIENIEKNTLQNAVGYEYFYDKWISFNDVMENIPSLINNEQQFLQTNKSLEVRDSSFVYLLNIKEYKLNGSEAPYDYIKGQLSEVFIELRKAEYLKTVKKDLYDKAISDGEIKFYDE
ncbi:MAG: peptidyl-prolyl cis-trans isomerase [Dysgonomonas sp.]|nr:peptidyl-prolyl cis-trans isomerase [Dysgonomonas sp.]